MRNLYKILSVACFALAILDFIAGDAHAEPMSTAMALLYGGLGGGALSGLGSIFGGKSKQRTGYDVVTMPQYDWTEQSLGGANSYLMEMLNSLRQGKEPSWMQNYLGPMQSSAQNNLRDTFYGSAGRPGVLRDVAGSAAGFGVGPKAAMNKTQQAYTDYMSESDKIDQYFNQMRYGSMNNWATQIPGLIGAMPKGPDSQLAVYGGTAGQTSGGSGLGGMLGQLAQGIPWNNMLSSYPSVTSQYTSQYPNSGMGLYGNTYSPNAVNFGNNSGVVGWTDNYDSYPVAK